MRRISKAMMLICGCAMLAGCSTRSGAWRLNYENYAQARFASVAHDDVVIVQTDWQDLQEAQHVQDCTLIARSGFTSYGQLDPDGADPDRKLRALAAEKGADYVRWSVQHVADAGGGLPDQYRYEALYYASHWSDGTARSGQSGD